ncbi:MAG: hypothetical protein LBG15_02950 [Dysgonamonadaceae bacterium]|nr:hypothetical protein [Dysgonamonadaceae bacterium]
MKKNNFTFLIGFALCAICVFVTSCEKDDNDDIVVLKLTDLEGVNFISECIEDWDCNKGLLISTVKGPNNATSTYDCETTDPKSLFSGAKLDYMTYDRQKKLLNAYYDITWLDYGAWAYRDGTATVSFYTKNKH